MEKEKPIRIANMPSVAAWVEVMTVSALSFSSLRRRAPVHCPAAAQARKATMLPTARIQISTSYSQLALIGGSGSGADRFHDRAGCISMELAWPNGPSLSSASPRPAGAPVDEIALAPRPRTHAQTAYHQPLMGDFRGLFSLASPA